MRSLFLIFLTILAFSVNAQEVKRYQIAGADIMMLKRQKLGSISLAAQLGMDGVEVDMGGLGKRPTFENALANDSIRKRFIEEAGNYKIQFASLAMSGYYAQSFCGRAEYILSIQDCIRTMLAMKVKVAFLPLGVQCDLTKNPEIRDSLVERLRIAGRMAEKAGVVIGIETALDAKGEKVLLKEIGSPGIKSYFNFSNALKNGRDLQKELRTLGKKWIIQMHCTDEDGVLLQDNKRLDMKAVKQTLDKMGWSGWLVIERSRDAKEPSNVKKNFGSNTTYLKSIFQ